MNWPLVWRSRFDIQVAECARLAGREEQWKARYKRIADQLHEKNALFTETRVKNAELTGQLAAQTQINGRLESDYEQVKLDYRQLVEKYNLAAVSAAQRQVTIPRDIFDEDSTQPDRFVDSPGADISEIHDKIETALSWRHGISTKD